jgi:hypothetical protein
MHNGNYFHIKVLQNFNPFWMCNCHLAKWEKQVTSTIESRQVYSHRLVATFKLLDGTLGLDGDY